MVVTGAWEEETYDHTIPTATECVLTLTPVDVNAIFVFKKDSGLTWFQITDYTYNAGTNTVSLVTPLTAGEEVQCKYMVSSTASVE